MMKNPPPTLYPDVNEILDRLLTDVQGILGDQMVGMYLFGSLANGDFDEHSDVDVLFVTDTIISDDMFNNLSEMHKRISACGSPWAIQLEVSYIPREAFHHFDRLND